MGRHCRSRSALDHAATIGSCLDCRTPRPRRPGRPRRPRARRTAGPARIVVLGDLMLDVVLAPDRALERGTDVPGRVVAGPGRLGGEHGPLARPARGADDADLRGRSRRGGPRPRRRGPGRRGHAAGRAASPGRGPAGSASSSRPDGERSFVADRGAADLLRPEDLRPAWFARRRRAPPAGLLALGEPLGLGRPAGDRARTGRRRDRQRRSRLDRTAARPGPPRRPRRSIAGRRARPAVRDRGRGGGPAGPLRRRGPARPTPRSPSSSAAPKGATVLAARTGAQLRFEVATEHVAGGRHDRRRRRLRCRVPRRLVRGPRGRAIAAGVAPARGPGRPPGGGPPAHDATPGAEPRLSAGQARR